MTAARFVCALVLSLFLCAPALAAEGTVLRIEGPRFFVDLGAQDGLRAGDSVEILRVVELYDPDQKRQLRDRFALGTGVVVEVGEVLTLVGAEQAVLDRLQPGDVVVAQDRPPPPELVSLPIPTPGAVGIGAEPASCATVSGLKKLVAAGVIGPDEQVTGVLTGHLLKDPDVVVRYHQGGHARSNAPTRCAADLSSVMTALDA